MPRSPRATAIDLYHSDALAEPLQIPPAGHDEEPLKALVDDTKPARYAALAHVIDDVLESAISKRDTRLAEGKSSLLTASYELRPVPDDQWTKLSDDFSVTLEAEHNQISERAHKLIDEYILLLHSIDPARHIALQTQLMAGTSTASSTMTNLLRNLPRIISRYHETADTDDFLSIARYSPNLVGRLALGCVNRMMAAREGLAEDSEQGWIGESTILDPAHFTLRCSSAGLLTLHYTNLDRVAVPEQQRYNLRGVPDGAEEVFVGDIACSEQIVIGCPITLLNGRMRQLWNWQIDEVVARGLWKSET